MARKANKSTVVAFKVEEELAEFLNQLPNKSDFIRRAIYSQLGVACPLCRGTGSVTKDTHDTFESFLGKWEVHACQGCGDQYPFPKDKEEAETSLKQHLENVLQSGPEFCYTCFSEPAHHHDHPAQSDPPA